MNRKWRFKSFTAKTPSVRRQFSCSQQGFSLIEFMVASAIGMIVLMAAGATYFTTIKLKQEVQTKVAYQQDMRNSADLFRRDVRQTGNFGCMSAPSAAVLNNAVSTDNQLFSQAALPPSIRPSDMVGTPLVLVYGHKTDEQSSTNCGQAISALSSVDAAAYVVAKTGVDAHYNLYRFVYTQGNWNTTPQMVAENVSNMVVAPQYQNSDLCPTSTADGAVQVGFTSTPKVDQLPILVTATLTTCPAGLYSGTACAAPETYVVQAMARQGNVCLSKVNDLVSQ